MLLFELQLLYLTFLKLLIVCPRWWQIMTVLTHPDEDMSMNNESTSQSPIPKISRALNLGLQKVPSKMHVFCIVYEATTQLWTIVIKDEQWHLQNKWTDATKTQQKLSEDVI